jgi:hypothetical protein
MPVAQHFMRYVIGSSLWGGAVGLGHAYTSKTTRTQTARTEAAFYYGISGLVLGPWMPVLVPAIVLGHVDTRCSMRLRRPAEE